VVDHYRLDETPGKRRTAGTGGAREAIGMPTERFGLLVVCHANHCRSPMIERLARRDLTATLGPTAGGLEVSSAGTDAVPGAAMHRHAAKVLAEVGADPQGFRSRPLSAPMVAAADLVLTATREQRARCVTLVPAALPRTFTFRQFARLAAAVDAERLPGAPPSDRARALLAESIAVRTTLQPVPPDEDDLPDPVARPVRAFRRCARDIERVCGLLAKLIAGPRPGCCPTPGGS
jgi:protein-tyrosine phosphatase